MIKRFEDIIAWQKARALASAVIADARTPPLSRDFPFRNQICSAALSVPSNIAEGFERERSKELLQFLRFAKASCAEVRSDMYVAFDVGYIDGARLESYLEQTSEVSRLIRGFAMSVERQLGTRNSELGT